ncbi:unnamed protein product, partial [Larinioides sclopetarius]
MARFLYFVLASSLLIAVESTGGWSSGGGGGGWSTGGGGGGGSKGDTGGGITVLAIPLTLTSISTDGGGGGKGG